MKRAHPDSEDEEERDELDSKDEEEGCDEVDKEDESEDTDAEGKDNGIEEEGVEIEEVEQDGDAAGRPLKKRKPHGNKAVGVVAVMRPAWSKIAKKAKGKAKAKAKESKPPEDDKDDGYGDRFRNVHYTLQERERLLEVTLRVLAEQGLNEEDAKEGNVKLSVWKEIAEESGLSHRTLKSVKQRATRSLYAAKSWSRDEAVQMKTLVQEHGSNWKSIGDIVGASCRQTQDKWKQLLVNDDHRRTGYWTEEEIWSLKEGITECTGKLAPKENIPWGQVRLHVRQRSQEQCRNEWFRSVLPRLDDLVTRHGHPIPSGVLQRHLIRRLRKEAFETEALVQWNMVNKYWSAMKNKQTWRQLVQDHRRKIDYMPQGGEESMEFLAFDHEDKVDALYEALDCRTHKHEDKKLLNRCTPAVEFDDDLKEYYDAKDKKREAKERDEAEQKDEQHGRSDESEGESVGRHQKEKKGKKDKKEKKEKKAKKKKRRKRDENFLWWKEDGKNEDVEAEHDRETHESGCDEEEEIPLGAKQELSAGDIVKDDQLEVIEAFNSDTVESVQLRSGEIGIVKKVNSEGNALVRFPGHDLQWIFTNHFGKLRKTLEP